MILIFSLLILFIIGTMSLTLYGHFKDNSQASIYSAIDMAISVNGSEVKYIMDRIQNASDTIHDNEWIKTNESQYSRLANLVCNYEKIPDESNFYEMSLEFNACLKLIDEQFKYCFNNRTSKYSYKVYIEESYAINRVLVSNTDINSSVNGLYDNKGVVQGDWYLETIKMKGDTCWFVMKDEPNRIYMAKALINRELQGLTVQEEVFGVLLLWFDAEWLTKRINSADVTDNTYIWVTNDNHQILYASDNDIVREFTDYALLENNNTKIFHFRGQEYLFHKTLLNDDLFMVTAVPSKDVSLMSFAEVGIILIFAIIMLCVGILLSVLLSAYVIKPLTILANHMEKGELKEIEYSYKENDEVSVLYCSFNKLIKHANKLMRDVMEFSEKKNKAELHALQAQINPHFIYNTLNSIAIVELVNGRKDIANVIKLLSQIIRYNVKEPDSMVSIRDEINIIQCYASIQNFCYHNKLQFHVEVEQEIEDFRIPKLIIQPLVENAVLHGTKLLEEDARVRVSVFREQDFICIQVWDNGIDADVAWINEYVKGREKMQRKTDSLGIRNVYKRIRMVYGIQAEIVYSQDKNGCTAATIYLPY